MNYCTIVPLKHAGNACKYDWLILCITLDHQELADHMNLTIG